jgi:hypothetical protein
VLHIIAEHYISGENEMYFAICNETIANLIKATTKNPFLIVDAHSDFGQKIQEAMPDLPMFDNPGGVSSLQARYGQNYTWCAFAMCFKIEDADDYQYEIMHRIAKCIGTTDQLIGDTSHG